MDEKQKLSLGMGILFLFVFIFFGSIIIYEKNKEIMIPKASKRLNEYIQREYEDIYNQLKLGKTTYNQKKKQYEVKVKNIDNHHLYFTVSYQNKKFSSTYQKDYVEGSSLIEYYQKQFNSLLNKDQKYHHLSIKFNQKLNKYSHEVYHKLMTNDNVLDLSIYHISCDIKVDHFDSSTISTSILELYQYILSKQLNPKYLNVVITDHHDISNAISIHHLDKSLLNDQLPVIISSVLKNEENLKDKYGITYQYIN